MIFAHILNNELYEITQILITMNTFFSVFYNYYIHSNQNQREINEL